MLFVCFLPLIISGRFVDSIIAQLSYSPNLSWGFAKPIMFLEYLGVRFPFLAWIKEAMISYGKYLLAFMLLATGLVFGNSKNRLIAYQVMFYSFYAWSLFMHPHYLVWIAPLLFFNPEKFGMFYLLMLTGHIYFLYMIRQILLGIGIMIPVYTWMAVLSFIFGISTWGMALFLHYKYMKGELKTGNWREIFKLRYWVGN